MNLRNINFKTTFIVSNVPYEQRVDLTSRLISWCNDNCTEQWYTISVGDSSNNEMKICSPTQHESPIDGIRYVPATIRLAFNIIITFESDKDASLFKLTWGDELRQDTSQKKS